MFYVTLSFCRNQDQVVTDAGMEREGEQRHLLRSVLDGEGLGPGGAGGPGFTIAAEAAGVGSQGFPGLPQVPAGSMSRTTATTAASGSGQPNVAELLAAMQLQQAQLVKLQNEMAARREVHGDVVQYQQLLKVQQEAAEALRAQEDQRCLDAMKNKTNKRLLGNLLKGWHCIEDLNNIWASVFTEDPSAGPVTLANIEQVNIAFRKQSEVLQKFYDWMVQERTFIEGANHSSEGWAAAEAMKNGTGVFHNADEENSKKLREAEAIVRREKKYNKEKKTKDNNKDFSGLGSYSRRRRLNRNSLDYKGDLKELSRSIQKLASGRDKEDGSSRDKSPGRRRYRSPSPRKSRAGPTCYKCFHKGHIASECNKK